jgi:hypothetical protein
MAAKGRASWRKAVVAAAVSKRRPKGSGHHAAKLTEGTVRRLRADRADGATLKSLSEKYNVHLATVQGITSGKLWRHILEREANVI